MPAQPSSYRLIASSESVVRDGLDDRCADLAAIVTSMRRLRMPDVASVIAVHRGRLHLALEGPRGEVEGAWDHIGAAFLHWEARVLWQGETPHRRLPRGPMHFVSGEPKAQHVLSHRLDQDIAQGIGQSSAASSGEGEAHRIFEALAQAAEHRSRRTHSTAAETALPDDRSENLATEHLANENSATENSADEHSANETLATENLTIAHSAAESEALDASFGTAVLSADRTFLRANACFSALLGYGPGELQGRPYPSTLCVTDEDHLGRLWAAMLRGETVRVDRRALRKDRSEIWLRSTYRPRRDEAGTLRDVTEVAVEITQEKLRQLDERGQITAINRSQAVIHFALDGTILDANALFLAVMGYRRDEVVGRHHRMFVHPREAESADYAAFWKSFAGGHYRADEFRRVAKGGRAVWLQATYNPIFDMAGRPFKIVKYATDVTAEKLQRADYEWQIAAIDKSNAVITFDLGGVILDANANFLDAFGYERDEVIGHHHRMFVDESFAHGAEYSRFWRDLAHGLHQFGEYTRIDKAGRRIWLQATYNPIFDMDGKPFKIVKYATIVTEERLRQAEHQGQIAAIHKAQAVAAFGLDGTILDANRRFLDLLGYRLADVRGCPHAMLIGAEDGENREFWADLARGRHASGDFKHLTRDGRDVWLQATYNPILDLEGRPFKIVQYASDVTAEKHRQAAIDGQLTAIHRSQGVLFLALDGTIVEINDHLLTVLGHAREDILGRHHGVLLPAGETLCPDYAAFWATLRGGGSLSNRYRLAGKDGRDVWLQATYNPILDLEGRPYRIVSLSTDVTAEVAMADAYRDAQRQATYDAATALPNRVRLLSHMAAALAAPTQRLVVLYLDLDRFKPVNDTFGHPVGDRVLREVADRMRRTVTKDQMAARVGGDEFVIVAPDLSDDEVEGLCRRLITAIAAPIAQGADTVTVGVSIGVAIAPADGATPDELLSAADAALYRSKEGGRGIFTVSGAPTTAMARLGAA